MPALSFPFSAVCTGLSGTRASSAVSGGASSCSSAGFGISPRLMTNCGSSSCPWSGSSDGGAVSSLTSGDFFAIVVSKDTPSTWCAVRFFSAWRPLRFRSLSALLSSACSRLFCASLLALSYALSPCFLTPLSADFPVMITMQIIISMISTTYVPAVPMAGTSAPASTSPSSPPLPSIR